MVKDDKGNPTPIQSLGKFEEPNTRFGFSIQMRLEEVEAFDKKQIALAIRNSTLDDEIRCSLLDEGIINKCEGCSLKDICDGIDKVSDDYVEKTTKVVNSFTFD